jgi:hypothetical protein
VAERHGRARARTVLVRLRSMTCRILCRPAVRRLLVIGGIAMAGWLAGGAVDSGEAHAGTAPGPAAEITSAVVESTHDTTTATARDGGRATHRMGQALKTRDAALRGVVVPRKGSGILGLPGKVKGFVAGTPSATDRIGTGVPWAPRHHANVVAVRDERSGADTPARLVASGALEDVQGAHARSGAHAVDAAPQPGLPHPGPGEIAVLPSAGTASTGGVAGSPAQRLRAVSRPAAVVISVVAVVPPAFHTATDEPALSPD